MGFKVSSTTPTLQCFTKFFEASQGFYEFSHVNSKDSDVNSRRFHLRYKFILFLFDDKFWEKNNPQNPELEYINEGLNWIPYSKPDRDLPCAENVAGLQLLNVEAVNCKTLVKTWRRRRIRLMWGNMQLGLDIVRM